MADSRRDAIVVAQAYRDLAADLEHGDADDVREVIADLRGRADALTEGIHDDR